MIPSLRLIWVVAVLIAGTYPLQQASAHPDSMFILENVGQVVQLTGLQRHTAAVYGTNVPLEGEWIVFNSSRDGDYEIFVMRPNGSDVRQLTDNSARDFWPDWSPDGSQIVFVPERDGNAEIYVMNSDGSDQRRLTDNQRHDCVPNWSPDGSQIVYQSPEGGDFELYVIAADGSHQQQLTDNLVGDFYPDW